MMRSRRILRLKKETEVDRETKKWLAVMSISIAAFIILLLLLSGFDLSGFEIHKGIKLS